MKTVRVAEELKRMDGGFLDREIAVPRDVESRPNRYGHTTWTEKMVLVRVIDFHGVTIEYSFLLKLLGMFKRTRVHTVEVEKCQDGLRITFGRATYLLKGIGDG